MGRNRADLLRGVDAAGANHLFAGEGQKIPCDQRGPTTRVDDDPEIFFDLVGDTRLVRTICA